MSTSHATAEPATAPPAGDLPPLPGRDHLGRFTRGNTIAVGNPFARRVAALRAALLATVTEDDIRAVAARLLEQAKEGDVPSARLLLSYTLGKPAAAPDPDSLDVQEWELLRQSVAPTGEMLSPLLRQVPVSTTCLVHAAAQPALHDSMVGQLDALFNPPPAPPADSPAAHAPAPAPAVVA